MATEARMSEMPAPGVTRARDGVVDRLVDLPDRLRGPAAAWLVALLVAIVVAAQLPAWLVGETAIGTVEPYVFLPAAIAVFFVGLIRTLRRMARSAFEDFQPALGDASDDLARLGWELARIPDRQGLIAAGAAILIAAAAGTSEGAFSSAATLPPVGTATAWTLWLIAIAILAVAVLYTLRQLRWVSRLYEMATSVDLFDTGPLNALSRLTATSGIGILLVALLLLFGSDESFGADPGGRWFPLTFGLVLILLASALFVLPLRGMHERLVAEKNRLLGESTRRMKHTLALIHGRVEANDFSQADELQKTLTSLLAERDVLAKLPTWPWSPGILRGFAAAAVLPVLLWLVIRLLERFVG